MDPTRVREIIFEDEDEEDITSRLTGQAPNRKSTGVVLNQFKTSLNNNSGDYNYDESDSEEEQLDLFLSNLDFNAVVPKA